MSTSHSQRLDDIDQIIGEFKGQLGSLEERLGGLHESIGRIFAEVVARHMDVWKETLLEQTQKGAET